ncbi:MULTISPECIES: gliding motility-associated peptidyl-prolyl isomerase GldI [Altibacter]|uniref:gliding motility-associated peptidyl-prolyl isomerase GldI n=1 Tax=Altibacter TaxID=1535231 RepID=UPI0005582DD5|nr:MULTISPECIES: gliding motility-associated peptidyl-prolyl isomerase GldI [Altibacter]MCW8981389.1 gliding motility-associated peptidyl-prolyl isomerase GldI [Altibacter sp.]MCW9038592.1 gliding motility-associated peptidyl-prolyl isomerase GldI [Altibacter sp.]
MYRNLLILAFLTLSLSACKTPEARRPVQQKSGSFIKESAERNKKIFQKEEARITKLMKANPERDYIASESGFWYFYNVKDTVSVKMPEFGDEVTFTFDIKDLGGTTILSEEENGLQTYIVDQTNQELISGIRDGIKLMKEGEQVTFLFPSYKAFGYYGIEDKLGTNIPVQSTVTLKSIEEPKEN